MCVGEVQRAVSYPELSPILTVRGMSLKIKGKIYGACVQSVMVYGSETWALKVSDSQQLERTERMMARWMCGVTLNHRQRSQDLLERLLDPRYCGGGGECEAWQTE